MTLLTRHLQIYGRVQGVGFRWSLHTEAKALGLTGWVRNRRDGSVEALLIGAPEAVATLTAWAYHGPSTARVERVLSDDEPNAAKGEIPTGFMQRPTF